MVQPVRYQDRRRMAVVLITLLFCAVPLLAAEDVAELWKHHRDRARQATREGAWELADQSYASAVAYAELFPAEDSRLIGTLRDWASAYRQRRQYDRAIDLQKRVVALQADHEATVALARARALFDLAQLQRDHGGLADAEESYRRALENRKAVDGSSYPAPGVLLRELSRTIEKLRADDPEVRDLLRERAELEQTASAWAEVGRYWSRREDAARAIESFARAVELEERRLVPDRRLLAGVWSHLGDEHLRSGEMALAETAYLRAVRLREEELGVEHPLLAHTLRGLAAVYVEDGRYLEAETHLLRIGELNRAAWGEQSHPCACDGSDLMGQVRRALGREDGRPPLEADPVSAAPEQPDPLAEQIATLDEQSAELRRANRYAEAEEQAIAALDLREERWGPESPHLLEGLESLAQIHRSQGDLEAAVRLYERSLAIIENHGQDYTAWLAATLGRLGGIHRTLRSYETAEQYHLRELDARELLGHRLLAARTLEALARSARERRAFDAAAQYHAQAAESWESFAGSRAPEIARNLTAFAWDELSQGRPETAEALLKQLVGKEEADDAHPDDLLPILHVLRELYLRQQSAEVADVEARIQELKTLKSGQKGL